MERTPKDHITSPGRINVRHEPCGFCGRSEPHEHALAEFEAAEKWNRDHQFKVHKKTGSE